MSALAHMSLRGGVVILAVVLLRALLLDRLPKRTFLALWAVAWLTLLLPWSLPAPTSVWGLVRQEAPAAATEPEERAPFQWETSEPVSLPPETASAAAPDARQSAGAAPAWTWVWLAGAGLLLSCFLAAWLRWRLRFRAAVPADNPLTRDYAASAGLRRRVSVRESAAVASPLTYGVLRPVILFLRGTVWERSETLDIIFAHELTHIRRFDAARKGLLALCLAVHWFNPLVWVMVLLANRDLELACDEAVLRRLGRDKRRAYALTLLELEEKRSGPALLMNGLARSAVKQRVRSVMNMKQRSVLSIVLAVLLVAGIYAVFATTAQAEEPEETGPAVPAEAPETAAPAAEGPGRTEPFVTEWQTEVHEGSASAGGDGVGYGETRSACAVFGLNEGAPVSLHVKGGGATSARAALVDHWTGKTVAETETVELHGEYERDFELTAPYTEYFEVRLHLHTGGRSWMETTCSAEAAVEPLTEGDRIGGYAYQSEVRPYAAPEGGRYETEPVSMGPSHQHGGGGAAGGTGWIGGLNEGDSYRIHVWGAVPGKLEVGIFNIDTRELSFQTFAPYGALDETAELTVPSTGRYQFYLAEYGLGGAEFDLHYAQEGQVHRMQSCRPPEGPLDRLSQLQEPGDATGAAEGRITLVLD